MIDEISIDIEDATSQPKITSVDLTSQAISRSEWLRSWSIGGIYYNLNRSWYSTTGKRFGEWAKGREIRVFREPTVNRYCVEPVVSGINEIIDDVGLKLSIVDYDTHNSVLPIIQSSLTPQGRLDGRRLGELLFMETYRNGSNDGRQHADVILTDKSLGMGSENWGQSSFGKGYMVLSLPPARQGNYRFIGNIGKHEGTHLLGFNQHHDTVSDVAGYTKPSDCLMYWRASTRNICDRDREALQYFWKNLEKDLGTKLTQ